MHLVQYTAGSNIYLLMQVEGLAAPDGVDIDLWLECPKLNIPEQISLVLIYRPREDGQLSCLVPRCECSSDDWVRTWDLQCPNPAP